MLENNPTENVNGASDESSKRKADEERHQPEEPVKKKKMVEHKCAECDFKCYNEAELKTHETTSHGPKKRMKLCNNCAFTSSNTWEVSIFFLIF